MTYLFYPKIKSLTVLTKRAPRRGPKTRCYKTRAPLISHCILKQYTPISPHIWLPAVNKILVKILLLFHYQTSTLQTLVSNYKTL